MTLAKRLGGSLVLFALLAGCSAPPIERSSGTSAAQTDGKESDDGATSDNGGKGGADDSYGDETDPSASSDKSGGATDSKSAGSSNHTTGGTIWICNQREGVALVAIVMADITNYADNETVWTGNLVAARCAEVPIPNRRSRVYYRYADHRAYYNSIGPTYTPGSWVEAEPGPNSPDDEWQRW